MISIEDYINTSAKDSEKEFLAQFGHDLAKMYCKPNDVVYDPFSGTGTTGDACIVEGINFVLSEISERYVVFTKNRLKNRLSAPTFSLGE